VRGPPEYPVLVGFTTDFDEATRGPELAVVAWWKVNKVSGGIIPLESVFPRVDEDRASMLDSIAFGSNLNNEKGLSVLFAKAVCWDF
jgi:hypothetical protein